MNKPEQRINKQAMKVLLSHERNQDLKPCYVCALCALGMVPSSLFAPVVRVQSNKL